MAMSCPKAEPASARLAPSVSPISRNFFIVDLPECATRGCPSPADPAKFDGSYRFWKIGKAGRGTISPHGRASAAAQRVHNAMDIRSEERRVGKEGRSWY